MHSDNRVSSHSYEALYCVASWLGTSTGSILAAYVATKGGTAYDNIIGDSKQYGDGVAKAKTFISNLDAGQWEPRKKGQDGFDPLLTTDLVEGKWWWIEKRPVVSKVVGGGVSKVVGGGVSKVVVKSGGG